MHINAHLTNARYISQKEKEKGGCSKQRLQNTPDLVVVVELSDLYLAARRGVVALPLLLRLAQRLLRLALLPQLHLEHRVPLAAEVVVGALPEQRGVVLFRLL